MNITGIGINGTSNYLGVASVNSGVTKTPSSIPPAAGSSASAGISQPGELMGKLQQLSQQDPTKFKEVMSDIADKLREQAQQSGDPNGMVGKLADKFAQAAQTGDMSPFQPNTASSSASQTGQVHHGHHHHGHGGGGGASGAIQSVLSSAIDEVNQALGLGTSTAATTTTTTTTTTTGT